MNEYKDITAAMLPMLEEKLNAAPSIFKLWFSDLSLISMDETTAVFTTTTDLRKKILLSKYIGIIKETLEEVIGFPLEIEILSLVEINKVGEEEDEIDIPVHVADNQIDCVVEGIGKRLDADLPFNTYYRRRKY